VAKRTVEITAGQRLKAWADDKGLTQREIAEKLGITEAYVSSLVLGKETPGLTLAVKIETLTGIAPRDFAEVA